MKCPLRKIITKSSDGYTNKIITEEFADCLGKECPYYKENRDENKVYGKFRYYWCGYAGDPDYGKVFNKIEGWGTTIDDNIY